MAQLLGQTEAFEPGPRRKLIVPAGATAWWGVDCSTRIVAVGYVRSVEGALAYGARQLAFRGGDDGERLRRAFECAGAIAHDLALEVPPGVVVVEQPSGKFIKPTLSYAVGAIVAGVSGGLEAVDRECRVEFVTSSAWKKEACGRGDIRKPVPASGIEYPVLAWARSVGYDGSSYDIADAMGVCEYARRTIQLEER